MIIGGPPFVGKTTLGRLLAGRLEYSCVSTDDLTTAVRAMTVDDSVLNPALGRTWEEYYLAEPVDKLVADLVRQHERFQPAVLAVVREHLRYSGPVVLEGWCAYPRWFAQRDPRVATLWLIAEPAVLLERMQNDWSFFPECPRRAELLEKFLARSIVHCRMVEDQALATGQQIVRVARDTTLPELLATCLR